MRTPLAVIGGAASSLAQQDSRLSAEARRELAQSIVNEATQMTQLIANLLDMTRLEVRGGGGQAAMGAARGSRRLGAAAGCNGSSMADP